MELNCIVWSFERLGQKNYSFWETLLFHEKKATVLLSNSELSNVKYQSVYINIGFKIMNFS